MQDVALAELTKKATEALAETAAGVRPKRGSHGTYNSYKLPTWNLKSVEMRRDKVG